MPSLADTLDQLRSLSGQITNLSRCNCRPSGPYTSVYLGSSVVPDLIRDGSDAEKRLFKFVGESDSSIKKVEKREGLVTPLKNLKAGRVKGGQSETDVVLNAVASLVDDYRPMPRARNHIASLSERHESQINRIAELEALIAKHRDPSSSVEQSHNVEQPSATPMAPKPKTKPVLSPDEAIRAEEESLKALDALIRPHREAAIVAEHTSPEKASSPIKQTIAPPQSPPAPTARQSIFEAQTPAKTPTRQYPHISNSLVTAATPFQSGKINRFTPLKNIGTPRTRERGSIFGAGPPRSVSGNRRSTVVPPPPSAMMASTPDLVDDDEEDNAPEPLEDETIRVPHHIDAARLEQPLPPTTPDRSTVSDTLKDVTSRASSVKPVEPSPAKGPRVIEGVEVDRDDVQAAISRIQASKPDFMRHAIGQDELISPGGMIDLLHRLSVAESETVPSSSESTASSSASGIAPAPITKSTILQAHLYLLLLRSPDQAVLGNEARARLTAVIEARQWDELKAATVVFEMAGRKALMIDRKSGGGPNGILRLV